jgi:hypothetical protein
MVAVQGGKGGRRWPAASDAASMLVFLNVTDRNHKRMEETDVALHPEVF